MPEMKTYIASTKFEVTKQDQTSSLKFAKGDTVQFDGLEAIYEGESYNLPKLKVAIRAKWLVDVDSTSTQDYRRPSANISLRGATPEQQDTVFKGAVQMSEEERVISTVQERSDLLDTGTAAQVGTRKEAAPLRSSMEVISTENSDAKVLSAGFKTAAKNRTDLSKLGDQNLRKIASLAEDPHADIHGGVPAAVGARTAEGITFRNENISAEASGEMTHEVRPGQPSLPVGAEAGQVVGSIHDRGKRPKATSDASVERARQLREERQRQIAQASQAVAEVAVPSDDDLDPKTKEGRYNVARIIHPELPDWDFSEHWTKKMARLKDEITDDIAVRAIYASESEAIKRRIVDELGITP